MSCRLLHLPASSSCCYLSSLSCLYMRLVSFYGASAWMIRSDTRFPTLTTRCWMFSSGFLSEDGASVLLNLQDGDVVFFDVKIPCLSYYINNPPATDC
jgi:hypothetical protein